MSSSARQRRMRRETVNTARYAMADMDFTRKPKEVDALTKAQNLKAASILLNKLYEQEVARNTPEVIAGYYANKSGKYVDISNVGRTPIDSTPPSDWPFSETEWEMSTQNGQFNLLSKIVGYVLHEQERQYRKSQALYDFGTSAIDPAQLDRLRKTKEKHRKINQRNWRNRMKNPVQAEQELAPATVPYVSSSDPYAQAVFDLTATTYAMDIFEELEP